MSRRIRAETAPVAESLPALQRRLGIPLLALVVTLVLLAAGDSVFALLQMREMGTELFRTTSVNVAVQSGMRSAVRVQLERHALLGRALGAVGAKHGPSADASADAQERFVDLGQELAGQLQEVRERIVQSGWSDDDISRTLRALVAFQAGIAQVDRAAESLLARARQGCDAACQREAVALEANAEALGLRAFALLEATSVSSDRLADLARASEDTFLEQTVVASAAALAFGIVISALLLRRILATLRAGIARREASEAALRRSEARLRATLDASIDPIITIGDDGLIQSASRALTGTFGWKPEEVVGRNVSVLMPEPHRSRHDGYVARYLESGEALVLGQLRELEAQKRDGTIFPCEIWVNAVDVPDGGAPLFCGVLRDITARKRGEGRLQQYASHLEVANLELADSSRELQDAIVQLRRSNEDLDEFAHVASHDLKEPLRGIHNYARFLLEDYGDKLDAEGSSRLETLSRLAQRLTSMIDALLEFSRLGRTDLAMTRTDLQTVLDGVLESLQITLQERNVAVRIPEPLPTVICSGVLVAEVLRNLIENAIRYNEQPQPVVEIGVRPESPVEIARAGSRPAVFYVRDNGIGIRERHLESAFRIFKRLNGRDRFGGGTGMGLTIVKKIVERHGGRVWIESKLGEGSTFFFTLCREG